MPELPEVEHAARTLRHWLVGHRILRAEVDKTRVVRGQPPRRIAAALARQTVRSIDRRAKFLMFEFDDGLGALAHLGMTGKWLRRAPDDAPSHSRLRLFLDDGSVVHYRDPRMFGQFQLYPAQALRQLPSIANLGPDPLAEGLTAAQLEAGLGQTKRPIKVALLDQGVVAGLGNIHAAEALYRAGIPPTLAGGQLTAEQRKRLVRAIHATIAYALKAQSAPDEIAYLEEGGENPFLVYGREGEPCPRCGKAIARIVQAGRSTFYCPGCQGRTVLGAGRSKRRAR
jgi:formamidopyrimidine-DNA glycosylase